MTTQSLKAIGLCAHYSPVGDRAMRYALALARKYGIQLNIFTFLHSPWRGGVRGAEMDPEEHQRRVIKADRRLREYYENRLGDYLEVGFRVCEGRENVELRRCLKRKEYDLLVVPYLETGDPLALVNALSRRIESHPVTAVASRNAEGVEDLEVERCAESLDEVRYRAACSLQEHAIPFAAACLREDAIAPNPRLRLAAADAALRLSPVGYQEWR